MTLLTTIDRNNHIPFYVQVKRLLQEHIESGGWAMGDQLPGEPELCRIFDVSRTVIRQALRELEAEGLIIREKGRGTFVAEPKIEQNLFRELTGFYQDMISRGHEPLTTVLKQDIVPATPKVADRLRLDLDEQVIEIHRLRGIKNEPIILDTTYLPYKLCPKLYNADLSQQSLYAFLEGDLGLVIATGRRTLEAVLANEYQAHLLQINTGDPLIYLDSVSYLEDGTPIEYFHGVHRGGRARFQVDLIRIRK